MRGLTKQAEQAHLKAEIKIVLRQNFTNNNNQYNLNNISNENLTLQGEQ